MAHQSSIEKRISQLEHIHSPIRTNFPVCFVGTGKNRDEIVANHRIKHNMPDDARLHVVSWMSPKHD